MGTKKKSSKCFFLLEHFKINSYYISCIREVGIRHTQQMKYKSEIGNFCTMQIGLVMFLLVLIEGHYGTLIKQLQEIGELLSTLKHYL